MSGTKPGAVRLLISLVVVLAAMTATWRQLSIDYTVNVLSAEAHLRRECERLLATSSSIEEVRQHLQRLGYRCTVEGLRLYAESTVVGPFPIRSMSVTVGAEMTFSEERLSSFYVYVIGAAL